jgi:hypothetical protein
MFSRVITLTAIRFVVLGSTEDKVTINSVKISLFSHFNSTNFNKNVDIKFSVHNMFLHQVKVERLESQIIYD